MQYHWESFEWDEWDAFAFADWDIFLYDFVDDCVVAPSLEICSPSVPVLQGTCPTPDLEE